MINKNNKIAQNKIIFFVYFDKMKKIKKCLKGVFNRVSIHNVERQKHKQTSFKERR